MQYASCDHLKTAFIVNMSVLHKYFLSIHCFNYTNTIFQYFYVYCEKIEQISQIFNFFISIRNAFTFKPMRDNLKGMGPLKFVIYLSYRFQFKIIEIKYILAKNITN